ncbi:MAG: DUF169 domain-containing protein [Chloroflexi bacterium]|nr:DUF169 domain-containing protein [Chloroflexota bacterium]
MSDYARAESLIRSIVGIERSPVAVHFVPAAEDLPKGFEAPPKRRYCQVLMEASEGKKVLLTPDTAACPASAAALGFKPLPETLRTGEMLEAYGIFASRKAGKNTIDSMPNFPMGKYRAVAACPLGQAPYEPDVVVVESEPEHLMWIALASIRETGGRMAFSTAILQATCVDGTMLPFINQKLNASMGCYGCREATDMAEMEAILGLPGKDLDMVVAQLQQLSTKAMGRVRGKAVYHGLVGRAS